MPESNRPSPWCETCGKELPKECPTCTDWWAKNSPPSDPLPSDEQSSESLVELVSRLVFTLGLNTDHDNYTFCIKRGNLRRLLMALVEKM